MACRELLASPRLEFSENISRNNFTISDAGEKIAEQLNGGGTVKDVFTSFTMLENFSSSCRILENMTCMFSLFYPANIYQL